MIKQIAWNTFKNTGNIDSYLEFIEVENIERQMQTELNKTIIAENKSYRTPEVRNNLGENVGIDTQKWVE